MMVLIIVALFAVSSAVTARNVEYNNNTLLWDLDGQGIDLNGGVVAPYDPKIIPDRKQSSSGEKGEEILLVFAAIP